MQNCVYIRVSGFPIPHCVLARNSNVETIAEPDRHNMMRIVVILAAIAAFGHHVSSRPQKLPFDPSSFLGGNNNNGAPFGCNPASLLNPDSLSAFVPVPGGQAQATAAPVAPAEAGSARKKRSPGGFPFQGFIPTGIPNNWFPAGIPGAETVTVAKPSGD